MLRFLTSGESHGKGITVIIDGFPSGVPISSDLIKYEMKKRQVGTGSGGRMDIEKDNVEIISGIRFGKTTGAPITLFIANLDAKNWEKKMSTEIQEEKFVNSLKIKCPRPGHADLNGMIKYKTDDARNILERTSARETVARVAMGAICKQFLSFFSIKIASHTYQIGNIKINIEYSFDEIFSVYENDPETRCIDKKMGQSIHALIEKTRENRDTLGGIVEVWAVGLPIGLGSSMQYDSRIDASLAHALMSIQSVKAVEIGDGVLGGSSYGSDFHDEIFYDEKYYRKTNRAGGIEGGITNGMPIIARAYLKPISTLYNPLQTVNIETKKIEKATIERSDVCVVPRGGVVIESMVAYIIMSEILKKFGGDCLEDILSNYYSYLKRQDL